MKYEPNALHALAHLAINTGLAGACVIILISAARLWFMAPLEVMQ